jgi:hypothetical protein
MASNKKAIQALKTGDISEFFNILNRVIPDNVICDALELRKTTILKRIRVHLLNADGSSLPPGEYSIPIEAHAFVTNIHEVLFETFIPDAKGDFLLEAPNKEEGKNND